MRLRVRIFSAYLALVTLAAPVSAAWSPWGGPTRPGMTIQLNPRRPELLFGRVQNASNTYALWRSEDAGVSWHSAQTGLGQSIGALAIDPQNAQVIWVWTASGEVWRSGDAGDTWTQRSPGSSQPQVLQLQVDRDEPETLYRLDSVNENDSVGTRVSMSVDGGASFLPGGFLRHTYGQSIYSQGSHALVSFDERGLQISQDGGQTWSLGSRPRRFGFKAGRVAPSSPTTLYGLLTSQFQCVARSDDASAHWQALPYPSHLGDSFCDDLAVDPLDARHLWITGHTGPGHRFHRLLFESHDSGESWSRPLYVRSETVVAGGGEVIYSGDNPYETGLDVSRDGGRTWSPGDQGIAAGDLRNGFFAQPIPGGSRLFALNSPDGFPDGGYRTDDGKKWLPLLLEDVQAITGAGTTVAAVDDRGVVVSRDGGESWQVSPSAPRNFSGFRSDPAQPRYLALLDFETNNIEGDNLFFWTSDDGGGTWRRSGEGLDTECSTFAEEDLCPQDVAYAVDPFHTNRRWVAQANPFSVSGVLLLSEDAGVTWTPATSDLPIVSVLAADSAVEGRLLAATQEGLYLSQDGGRNWAPFGDLPNDAIIRQLAHDSRVSAWYAATDSQGIYRSLDAGAHWTPLAGVPDRRNPTIAIDPAEPGALFAAFQGQGAWRWTP